MLIEAEIPKGSEVLRTFALEKSRTLAEMMAAKARATSGVERVQLITDL